MDERYKTNSENSLQEQFGDVVSVEYRGGLRCLAGALFGAIWQPACRFRR